MNKSEFIKVLFNAGEHFCYGDKFCRATTPVQFIEDFYPYRHPSKTGKLYISSPIEFLCLNPLKEGNERADKNVSAYRNMLFEFDRMEIRTQLEFVRDVKLPISTIVYSGSKSLHCVLSLEEPLLEEEEYRVTWFRIADYLYLEAKARGLPVDDGNKTVVDHTCRNPSRLTRFPNVVRRDKNRLQELLKVKERISIEKFKEFLSRCPEARKFKTPIPEPGVKEKVGDYDQTDFYRLATSQQLRWIKDLQYNAASQGMHHKLFRLYCSVAKHFKCDAAYIKAMAEDLIFPYLRQAGYDESKIRNNDIDSAVSRR